MKHRLSVIISWMFQIIWHAKCLYRALELNRVCEQFWDWSNLWRRIGSVLSWYKAACIFSVWNLFLWLIKVRRLSLNFHQQLLLVQSPFQLHGPDLPLQRSIFRSWTIKWKLVCFAFPRLIAGSDNFFLRTERERLFEHFSQQVVPQIFCFIIPVLIAQNGPLNEKKTSHMKKKGTWAF